MGVTAGMSTLLIIGAVWLLAGIVGVLALCRAAAISSAQPRLGEKNERSTTVALAQKGGR